MRLVTKGEDLLKERRLIIVCGVPGAGKSTFADRMAKQWSATSFASEVFTRALGDGARDATGDLTREAIARAYADMAMAVADALKVGNLVVAVGAFRSEALRHRFRQLAANVAAVPTTVRISCAVAEAARRVRVRGAQGERGPTEPVIGQIDAELARADDINFVIENNSTMTKFFERTDAFAKGLMEGLSSSSTAMLPQIPPH